MEKTIYNLKLHEELKIDDYCMVKRVPGGWLYFTEYYTTSKISYHIIFVSFNDEFMNDKKRIDFGPL